MKIDITKASSVVRAETLSDPITVSKFLTDFTQAIRLIESAIPAIHLDRVNARFIGNGNWKIDFDINNTTKRAFTYELDISVTPILVKTTSNDWFTEEELAAIERINQEIEKLRQVHRLIKFDLTNT